VIPNFEHGAPVFGLANAVFGIKIVNITTKIREHFFTTSVFIFMNQLSMHLLCADEVFCPGYAVKHRDDNRSQSMNFSHTHPVSTVRIPDACKQDIYL